MSKIQGPLAEICNIPVHVKGHKRLETSPYNTGFHEAMGGMVTMVMLRKHHVSYSLNSLKGVI